MTSDNIITVQDLVSYLLTCDPANEVVICDEHGDQEHNIFHIDIECDRIIIYY